TVDDATFICLHAAIKGNCHLQMGRKAAIPSHHHLVGRQRPYVLVSSHWMVPLTLGSRRFPVLHPPAPGSLPTQSQVHFSRRVFLCAGEITAGALAPLHLERLGYRVNPRSDRANPAISMEPAG